MNSRTGGSGAPATAEEARARDQMRRQSLRVSTFCLHSMAWLLATFYATDYLPPLLIRSTVGLGSPRSTQFAVGYLALASICLLLGIAFGITYGRQITRSRYRLRWYFFPIVVAILLIPAQGENELLSKLVELICLGLGLVLGLSLSRPARQWLRLPGRGA